ncbi:hypothetical protein ACKW6Q_19170 [Chryseobacterium kwangjuense]|uniref:Uncharacterized protein n=1 Tax=Chryseobacterium kwangjuense TaxID=267125 RepID=A0ABW9K713_9FLAO
MKIILMILFFAPLSYSAQKLIHIIQYKGMETSTVERKWLTTNIFLYNNMNCKMQVITYASRGRQKDNVIENYIEKQGSYRKFDDTIHVKLKDELFERNFLLKKGKIYPLTISGEIIKMDGKWRLKD